LIEGNTRAIAAYQIPPGQAFNQNYIFVASVDDLGGTYGELTTGSAYWPTPSQAIQVPNIDSTAQNQTLTGMSPDGQYVIGTTLDINNSGGPGRGFVYSVATQQFQVLPVSVPGNSYTAVRPQAITDGGVITGYVNSSPTLTSYNGLSTNDLQLFSYNLSTRSLQLNRWPNEPTTIGGFLTYSMSANGAFLGGSTALGTQVYPQIYSQTGSPTLVASDPADLNWRTTYVSNDGSVAVIMPTTASGTDQVSDAKIWIVNRGFYSVRAMITQANLGSWPDVYNVAGSPLGHYLLAEVSNGGPNSQFLIHVK
jgi:hypothetical protein